MCFLSTLIALSAVRARYSLASPMGSLAFVLRSPPSRRTRVVGPALSGAKGWFRMKVAAVELDPQGRGGSTLVVVLQGGARLTYVFPASAFEYGPSRRTRVGLRGVLSVTRAP